MPISAKIWNDKPMNIGSSHAGFRFIAEKTRPTICRQGQLLYGELARVSHCSTAEEPRRQGLQRRLFDACSLMMMAINRAVIRSPSCNLFAKESWRR
jgi:hypothetical protein